MKRSVLATTAVLVGLTFLPLDYAATEEEIADVGQGDHEVPGDPVPVGDGDGFKPMDDSDATLDVELSEGGLQCNPGECWIAPRPWTDADVRDALAGRSLMVRRIVYCEVGRSGIYDPYAIGSEGEIGPAQLLPGRGNGLSIFYHWGFTEPNDPWQAVAFIERVERERMLGSQYPRTRLGCVGSP